MIDHPDLIEEVDQTYQNDTLVRIYTGSEDEVDQQEECLKKSQQNDKEQVKNDQIPKQPSFESENVEMINLDKIEEDKNQSIMSDEDDIESVNNDTQLWNDQSMTAINSNHD